MTLTHLAGLAYPLTIADAIAIDGGYTWPGLIGGPAGTPYGLRVNPLPAGYNGYVVVGDTVEAPAAGAPSQVRLYADAPNVTVFVYAFAPEPEPAPDQGEQEPPAVATEPADDTTVPAPEPTDNPEQEAPSGRPAAIIAGGCDDADDAEAGEVVTTLTGLAAPEGSALGSDAAIAVETSYSLADLPLETLLAEAHAVVVFGEEDGDITVACAAVGGVPAEDGSLAIGLSEVDGSGYAGVIYLAPDDEQTGVTVFLATGLSPEAD